MRYHVPQVRHGLAELERIRLRALGRPRDLCSGTMRLALHLAEEEADELIRLNPDTLGHSDDKLRDLYWRDFCESPDSAPYRVNTV